MNQTDKILGIIVPYRDRAAHLAKFVPHYRSILPQARIFVIEQADDKPFNRAKLLNIGYIEFKHAFEYAVFHDVDMLATKNIDYSYRKNPTHLAGRASQFNYKMPYREYFGGVTLFNKKDFETINGFSNLFFSWGSEDDFLLKRCKQKKLRPQWHPGKYESLHHERHIDPELYKKNVELLNAPIDFNDGLSSCEYQFVSTHTFEDYTQIKVRL